MSQKVQSIWNTGVLILVLFAAASSQVHGDSATEATDLAPESAEVHFGEEGDVILQVFLRDILLTDAMFAIMREGNIYIPLAEIASLLDFPIIVDPLSGIAAGWYINTSNTFTLDTNKGVATSSGKEYVVDQSAIFSDDIDLYVKSGLLQAWFPLFFDISLPTQVMTISSSQMLPKESARQRALRNAENEIIFSAQRQFNVPGYRAIDWPEVAVNLGGFYMPETTTIRHDYRLRAVGDIAFMNGSVGFSGEGNSITGATITLGRKNPQGMLGPLRIADFEIGDTSQFLPGLLGSSLSGRGLRLGNTRLANQRDIDSIDLQGEQQQGFEIELYVNDRLRAVDRDSSDTKYDFQNVPLSLGQNEIRLEFYGPQGQRYTESSLSFVGSSQGRTGKLTYEFALLEPAKRTFDLIEEVKEARLNDEERPIQLSSALTMSYGLSKSTGIGLTIASLATNDGTVTNEQSQNHNYVNANISTSIAGTLLGTNVSMDPNGNFATSLTARGVRGNYETGISQLIFQPDYRTINNIDEADSSALPHLATALDVSRQYFTVPGGRMSYGANISYQIDHGDNEFASLGSRIDYQTRLLSTSWAHSYQRALDMDSGNSNGEISARLSTSRQTLWALSAGLNYSDSQQRLIDSGSLRLTRPITGNGHLSLSANRDLQESSTSYSASWGRQFTSFSFNSTIAGTSSEDISLRFGIDFNAKRYPGRWIPTIASTGGSASVAVLVFADDNNNGLHDAEEKVVEGIRLIRNGLISGDVTDSNGVAFMGGLSSNTSVDVSIVAADIKDPSLKYKGISEGILPRPGRVPLIQVPLQRATDLEGTVRVAGSRPAPNVRMLLTPVNDGDGDGEIMEVHTEFDGYYYLAGVPLGVYNFGPDPDQLKAAGLISQPPTKRMLLQDIDDFPAPEDFVLVRLADLPPEPSMQAAIPGLPLTSSVIVNGNLPNNKDTKVPDSTVEQSQLSATRLANNTHDKTSGKTNPNIPDHIKTNKNGDGDGDGVLDSNDRCRHTNHGSRVNYLGCVYIGHYLTGVEFPRGSDSVDNHMALVLDGLAREIKVNSSLKVVVETHTDSRGTRSDNMALSKRRAESILQYLTANSAVPAAQLSSKAMGEENPVASNRSKTGRKKNRRVFVKLQN